MSKSYIQVSEDARQHLLSQEFTTPIVMLNLLRFKKIADYSHDSHLSPKNAISGLKAYKIYMKNVFPLLSKTGGKMTFSGTADHFLIGPSEEKWDAVLMVKYLNMDDFIALVTGVDYLKIAGHRTAALADSRLLPLVEGLPV